MSGRAPIETEIGALAVRAQRKRDAVDRYARRMARLLGWQDNYRRLFCNNDTGALKPEAVAVFADLAREFNFGVVSRQASDAQLREEAAARHVLLFIFARLELGSDRLLKLAQDAKDTIKGELP